MNKYLIFFPKCWSKGLHLFFLLFWHIFVGLHFLGKKNAIIHTIFPANILWINSEFDMNIEYLGILWIFWMKDSPRIFILSSHPCFKYKNHPLPFYEIKFEKFMKNCSQIIKLHQYLHQAFTRKLPIINWCELRYTLLFKQIKIQNINMYM